MGIPSGYTSAQVVQAVPVITTSGLVCVKAETAFSAVSSFQADSVFTSTYTNYLILIDTANSADSQMQLQFRASGSTTSTNYNYNNYQAAAAMSAGGYNVNQSFMYINQNGGNSVIGYVQLNIFSPQLATRTGVIASNLRFDGSYSTPIRQGFAGNQNSATQFDGFIVTLAGGTATGSYTIYGYSKTV